MANWQHWYLTHPEVRIDPGRPVSDWELSDHGRSRIANLARSGHLPKFVHIVSSGERKAVETAEILARALSVTVEERPAMHENDRSSTGYLPREEFEAMADAFFAEPRKRIRGWESATAAQARIVREVSEVLEDARGPVLFVGHGAVGTLLWCHLSGTGIDRRHDQHDGGGCFFAFDGHSAPASGWRRIEDWTGATT